MRSRRRRNIFRILKAHFERRFFIWRTSLPSNKNQLVITYNSRRDSCTVKPGELVKSCIRADYGRSAIGNTAVDYIVYLGEDIFCVKLCAEIIQNKQIAIENRILCIAAFSAKALLFEPRKQILGGIIYYAEAFFL